MRPPVVSRFLFFTGKIGAKSSVSISIFLLHNPLSISKAPSFPYCKAYGSNLVREPLSTSPLKVKKGKHNRTAYFPYAYTGRSTRIQIVIFEENEIRDTLITVMN